MPDPYCEGGFDFNEDVLRPVPVLENQRQVVGVPALAGAVNPVALYEQRSVDGGWRHMGVAVFAEYCFLAREAPGEGRSLQQTPKTKDTQTEGSRLWR